MRRFGSVVMFLATDFEALYAYKRGNYQRCLQLSTLSVHTLLLFANYIPKISTFPEFIQLMDDDIVSLTALTLIVDRKCRKKSSNATDFTQRALSLYLMTQCQIKLQHSATSLTRTFDYIEFARTRSEAKWTLEHLLLKLTERKLIIYLSNIMQGFP